MESEQNNEENSLEGSNLETTPDSADVQKAVSSSKKSKGIGGKFRGLISHFNIYLLLFILIVVIAGVFSFASFQKSKKQSGSPTIQTQELTQDAIDKLKGSDATVGDPKQVLTIASNAVFSGKVFVRDSLDIAGGLKVGGSLNLAGLSVSGASAFDQLQANGFTLSGDANIQGQVTIQKSLTVRGGGSFSGALSANVLRVQNFQLSGDFQLNRHIDAGGASPGKSDGNALGNGGTVSLSGTDTAGTITINTGGSAGAGCFVTVTFSQAFNATPHVVVGPASAASSTVPYYVTRTATSFSLCTTSNTPSGQNLVFDYIAID